ncbi:MAG: orotate phosphoribosyltransferase [bacterium]
MTRKELAKAIYRTSHLTGEFKLRSGAISNEYFDKYLFEANPELLLEICKHLLEILPKDFEVLAGLEMGGIPIAAILSQLTGKPVCFVRKKAKEYGTCNLAEGADIFNKKLLVVEDVITSGGQVVVSSQELRDKGAIVSNAICVIDRESGGKDNLKAIGIDLFPLFTMSEIKGYL